MLRRNSSKRLGRRKSTSSVHSKHESIDPEVARQHAHAAATLAFARGQERHSADMDHRGGGTSRSNITSSHKDPRQSQACQTTTNVVKRQHSVRFAGPNAVQSNLQRDQSLGNRTARRLEDPKLSSASLIPMVMTTNDSVPAVYRPPSRSSSIGKASTRKLTTESYVSALAACNEYYTKEDDVASTPSSYRRIRRSKSMISPQKASHVFFTNGTPEAPVYGLRGEEQSIAITSISQGGRPSPSLRAPKSMSFLRGGSDYLTPSLRERNDEAVQMARDRFFHQATQQRLREQPSFLFRYKAQRQGKPFRQSVRSSSTNSYGAPVASANQAEQPRESKLKGKARRASKNIKEKFRRAFGRSKEEPVEIPNQQVDAYQTHVREYPGNTNVINESFENIPHPDRTTLRQVASRPPSIRPANSSQELRSHAGSIKSMKSDYSDKSRVTSWNSTGVNTIASQGVKPLSEREQKRLSVISENGTHVPSSSFNRKKLPNQFSAYPEIHFPSKSLDSSSAPLPLSVDSARVYSALMKRLDENSPKAKLEAARNASLESVQAPKFLPQRASSVHSSRGNQTPATIRQVPRSNPCSENGDFANHEHRWVRTKSIHSAQAENIFGHTGTHAHQWVATDLRETRIGDQDDVFSPKIISSSKQIISDRKENVPVDPQRSGSDSPVTHEASSKTSYHTAFENFGLTPQEIAYRNSPVSQRRKKLRETKSTFFGGTSVIERTTSHFRRALAEADYNSTVLKVGGSISLDDFPIPNSQKTQPKSGSGSDLGVSDQMESDKAYSESIYSRTPSGQFPAAANSALSLPASEDATQEMQCKNANTGDAIILDRATYRAAMPNAQGHRVISSASSTEWKRWMSSEVSKLERARDHSSEISCVNYALPTMPKSFHSGHVRESAQINDDDTDIAERKVSAVKQPLGISLQTTVQTAQPSSLQNPPLLKSILKNRSTTSLVDKIESTRSESSSIPIPPPPPIPPRSPLRQIQSKSSLRSTITVNTIGTVHKQSSVNSPTKILGVNAKILLPKKDVPQMTPCSTSILETPARLVKRNVRKDSNTANTPSLGDGLSVAAEGNFGSASMGIRPRMSIWSPSAKSENQSSPRTEDIYGSDGAGLMGPVMSGGIKELDAEQMGSKRMVDLFLSSRRKRMASECVSETGSVFV